MLMQRWLMRGRRWLNNQRWFKKCILVILACVLLLLLLQCYSFYNKQEVEESAQVIKIFNKNHVGITKAKTTKPSMYNRKGGIVVITTYYRSGSTFLGQAFNQNPDVFYLFEPLFPFIFSCDEALEDARLRTLSGILKCNFHKVLNEYKEASNITQYNDKYAKCLSDNLCFHENHRPLLQKYADLCMAINDQFHGHVNESQLLNIDKITKLLPKQTFWRDAPAECRAPYNSTLQSAICHSSKLVAVKIMRICDISRLNEIYLKFNEEESNVFVIHLVRDPRAMLSSGLRLEIANEKRTEYIKTLCAKMKKNLQFEDSNYELQKHKKYYRVRYEDIATNPIAEIGKLYNFIETPLHPNVIKWIKETSTNPHAILSKYNAQLADKSLSENEIRKLKQKIREYQNQLESPFGTVREPTEVLRKWRKQLPYGVAKEVQEHCSEVLQKLGYKSVMNENELRDLKLKLW